MIHHALYSVMYSKANDLLCITACHVSKSSVIRLIVRKQRLKKRFLSSLLSVDTFSKCYCADCQRMKTGKMLMGLFVQLRRLAKPLLGKSHTCDDIENAVLLLRTCTRT